MKKPDFCALLIDDDRATNFFNKMMVTKHVKFSTVVTVESGQEALEYLELVAQEKAAKPNIIFLDINMPVMNGWEFLVAYRKLDAALRKEIKVIMLTTSSNPDDFVEGQNNENIADYINKPLSIKLLDDIVDVHFSGTLLK